MSSTNTAYYELPSRGHIRLFSIDIYSETLSGQLSMHTLNNCPEYIALSYTWGSPYSLLVIRCSGALIQIRENLYTALQEFQRSSLAKHIWIDALCINQMNSEEKSYQVPLMRQIYVHATNVYVWLGKASVTETEAFLSVPSIAGILQRADASLSIHEYGSSSIADDLMQLNLPPPNSPSWPALGRILKRPWFTRLWVLQEVLLAADILVICGAAAIRWNDLVQFERDILRHKLYMLLAGGQFNVSEIFRALNCLSNLTWCRSKMATNPSEELPVPALLHIARRREVTLPHDRVYGILGLTSRDIRDTVTVDYSLPCSMVYTNFIRQQLPSDAKLEFRSQIEDPRNPGRRFGGLPSWCPDLGRVAPVNRFEGVDGIASGFHAGFRGVFMEMQVISISSSSNVIKINGCIVDRIAGVVGGFSVPYPPNSNVAAGLLEWLDNCLKLSGAALHEGLLWMETFARALVANRELTSANLYKRLSGDSLTLFNLWKVFLVELHEKGSALNSVSSSYPVLDARRDREFLSTVAGRVGYGPPGTEIGDVVCVFKNSIVPFVLRHSSNKTVTVVGEAYIEELMYGEVLTMCEEGIFEFKEIEIV